jgi:glutamine synthetase
MQYIRLDYVWIDGTGNIRSKNRIISNPIVNFKPVCFTLDHVPAWNFDGSSTSQASVSQSEIQLKPVKLFNHPLVPDAILVLCETYTDVELSIVAPYNHRRAALDIFNKCDDQKCWFGLEQEYFVIDPITNKPVGWQSSNAGHYCGVSASHTLCRRLVDQHLTACLDAGIKICGTNAEVATGQWEFQIGPISGIDAADHLWMARYLLQMIAESLGVNISYQSKLSPEINGSGCHINFSTRAMRSTDSYANILTAIDKLSHKHTEHILVYGENNKDRLTGTHETSAYDKFTYGVGDRSASIRIPQIVHKQQMGYIEDRRPSANCDPYLATSIMASTICL